jgi:hypothetical protein
MWFVFGVIHDEEFGVAQNQRNNLVETGSIFHETFSGRQPRQDVKFFRRFGKYLRLGEPNHQHTPKMGTELDISSTCTRRHFINILRIYALKYSIYVLRYRLTVLQTN